MLLLELTLISLLLLQGISGEAIFIYRKPGEQAVLPCRPDGSFPSTCSTVTWTYNRDQNEVFNEVQNGNVQSSSGRAGRLSVDSECSLVIEPVSAEDVGFYVCRQRRDLRFDVSVYLSILTVSPKDAGPQTDGEVPLECSLLAYSDNNPCQKKTFRWMNEIGSVLHKDDNMNCVSVLTVKRPSGSNRKFTCQLFEDNALLRKAHYTLRSTDLGSGLTPTPPAGQTYYIVGGVLGAAAVLVTAVAAAVFIQSRKRAAAAEGAQKSSQQPDEPESNLTYVTVNHANHQASPYRKVKEEVTYSAVKHSTDRSKR